ncbi:WXG100 family type VII secretion target [Streptacidiphilus sp. EB103A]|uniref:WXG100 family type VII secretion target n=1 Tax=Streptacidiphilus sp. EB103A TaxID=3156275 RepID=UPI003512E210
MRLDTGGGDSWAATTNFEQFTHADLIKMMAGSNPQTVTKVGTTLAAASTHMQSLADDLATHINGLVWDGEAGDAFKTWARQVVSATDTLAIFANNTAVAINMAGETLSSTQVPPIPAADQATVNAYKSQFGAQTYIGTDGEAKVAKPLLSTNPVLSGSNASSAITHLVTQETAYQAQTRLDAAHQEAIGQMEKLGGAYVGAKSTLTVSTIPTFPPTPAALMPPPGSGYQASSSNLGGVNSGSTSTGVTGGVATTVSGTKSTRKTASGSTSEGGSGTSTFEPVTSPGSSSGSGTGSGSTGGGSTTLQGVTDPNTPSSSGGSTGSGSSNSSGSGGGTSTITPVAVGGGGAGGGVNGGSPGSGGSKSGGLGSGSAENPGPGVSGGSSSGRKGGVTGEPEPGIHGGMPAAAGGRTSSRLSSGVIGAEGGGAGASASALGRGRIGGAAAGEAASVAESAGSSTARSGLGGAAGEGAAAAAAGEGGGSGMMPMGSGGMGGAGSSGKGRKRKRAAYLTEDEETWTQDVQANPTVIQ